MGYSEEWPGLPKTLEPVADRLVEAGQAAPDTEICGLIIDDGQGWQYLAADNLSAVPASEFRLSARQLEQAKSRYHRVVIFHTHPNGPACPSIQDMTGCAESAVPWLILGYHEAMPQFCCLGWPEQPPLERRPYIHGVTDCYSLIRDYYQHQFSLGLADYPRQWGWWHQGDDMYQRYFEQAGFYRLEDNAPLRTGDVFLAAIRSQVANHGGIYLGDGLIFHHLAGRLAHDGNRNPALEPAERWMKFITCWLRHTTHRA